MPIILPTLKNTYFGIKNTRFLTDTSTYNQFNPIKFNDFGLEKHDLLCLVQLIEHIKTHNENENLLLDFDYCGSYDWNGCKSGTFVCFYCGFYVFVLYSLLCCIFCSLFFAFVIFIALCDIATAH